MVIAAAGTPVPGGAAATEAVKLTGWPTTDDGTLGVIDTVVCAAATVSDTVALVLGARTGSPDVGRAQVVRRRP